jgi:hypothetical protein
MKKILASVLAAVLFCAATAQTGVPGEISTSFVQVRDAGDNTGPTLRPCMLWLPDTYETDETYEWYPLLVYLHGFGDGGPANGSSVSALKNMGPLKFLDTEEWDGTGTYTGEYGPVTKKFVVFGMQCPYFENVDQDEFEYALQQLLLRYRIDPNRIIFTGASGGGESMMLYTYDLSRSIRPRHIIPMSVPDAGSSTNISTLASAGMKVWAFASDATNSNYYITTNAIVTNFNNAVSGSAKFTSQSGNHCCWDNFYDPDYTESDGLDDLNVYDWAAKQSFAYSEEPAYYDWTYKFAGFITEPQSTKAAGCTTGTSIPIYTISGTVSSSNFIFSSYNGCWLHICNRYDGDGDHFGLSSLKGGSAEQHVIISSYGITTTVESCLTLAGYVSSGTYGDPGGRCSASCSTAVYSNAGIIDEDVVLYTSSAGTAVFAGGWADFGFTTTHYGTATRTINVDGSGVILRDDACPYSGPIANPQDFLPTDIAPNETIRIFPNPASRQLNIQLGSNADQITIRLYNLNGVLVYQSKANSRNHIITTEKFSKGVYMLKLSNSKGSIIQTKKIIIQ